MYPMGRGTPREDREGPSRSHLLTLARVPGPPREEDDVSSSWWPPILTRFAADPGEDLL